MNQNLFNFILYIAIPLIGGIITYFVIPLIKTHISESKLNLWKEWATITVNAAEQIWKETGKGTDKKAYAVEFLSNLINNKKTIITPQQIDALIEAAVKQLNIEQKKNH